LRRCRAKNQNVKKDEEDNFFHMTFFSQLGLEVSRFITTKKP
jgi:hypothetical protein